MVKEYFLHALAVTFVALAAWLQMWPLGGCAVIVALAIAAKDLHASYVAAQQDREVQKAVKAVIEENQKLKDSVDKIQAQLGVVTYQMNQVRDVVGAPING